MNFLKSTRKIYRKKNEEKIWILWRKMKRNSRWVLFLLIEHICYRWYCCAWSPTWLEFNNGTFEMLLYRWQTWVAFLLYSEPFSRSLLKLLFLKNFIHCLSPLLMSMYPSMIFPFSSLISFPLVFVFTSSCYGCGMRSYCWSIFLCGSLLNIPTCPCFFLSVCLFAFFSLSSTILWACGIPFFLLNLVGMFALHYIYFDFNFFIFHSYKVTFEVVKKELSDEMFRLYNERHFEKLDFDAVINSANTDFNQKAKMIVDNFEMEMNQLLLYLRASEERGEEIDLQEEHDSLILLKQKNEEKAEELLEMEVTRVEQFSVRQLFAYIVSVGSIIRFSSITHHSIILSL